MNAPRISARAALAATIGLDLAELSDYRYQSTRTPFAIYTFGEWYFATSPEKPKWKMKFEDGDWEEHPDRHFAQQAGTRIWQLRTVTSTRSAEKVSPKPQTATQVSEARVPFELAARRLCSLAEQVRVQLDGIDRLIEAHACRVEAPDPEVARQAINEAIARLDNARVQFQLAQQQLASY